MAIATGFLTAALLFVLLYGVGIVALGVYVARDARRRGLNPALWVLVVLLVPGFVGLIIYLLVRPGAPVYQCSQCGQPVETTFARCPNCGAQLLAACPNCGQAAQPGWKLCPHCGTELTASDEVHPPVRRKDGLWAVLVIVGVILLGFAVLILFSFASYSTVGGASYGGSFQVTQGTASETVSALASVDPAELQGNAVTSDWYRAALEDTGCAHVLSFETEGAAGGILLLAGESNCYRPVLTGQPMDSVYLLTLEEIEQSGGTSAWVFWYDTGEVPLTWSVSGGPEAEWTESSQSGALESLCRDWAGVTPAEAAVQEG